jgi:hypothetical protein
VYREELELRVGQATVDRTLGAWPLLVQLLDKGVNWAVVLAEQSFPADHQAQLKIVQLLLLELLRESPSFWLERKLEELLPEIPPPKNWWDLFSFWRSRPPSQTPDLLAPLGSLSRRESMLEIPLVLPEAKGRLSVGVVPLFPEHYNAEPYAAVARMPRRHPGWLPLILTHNFLDAPNWQTLSKVLRECANGGWEPSHKSYLPLLPWPLAACLDAVGSGQELQALANQVEKGALGNTAEWKAAEERWKSQGVTPEDFTQRSTGLQPFDSSIADRGFPPCFGWSITVANYPDALLQVLFSIAEQMPSSEMQGSMVWLLCEASSQTGGIARCIDPSRFRSLLERDFHHDWWDANAIGNPQQPEAVGAWLEFFDWLGCSELLSSGYGLTEHDSAWADTWQRAFVSNPPQLGFLRLLGRLASAGHASFVIPATMLDLNSFAEPHFRLAALLVRFTELHLTAADANDLAVATMALLALDPPAEPRADELVLRTIERHLDRVPALGQFLLRLHEQIPPTVELGQARCERLLREVLLRRPSDLQAHGQLQKLQLPMVPATESSG